MKLLVFKVRVNAPATLPDAAAEPLAREVMQHLEKSIRQIVNDCANGSGVPLSVDIEP